MVRTYATLVQYGRRLFSSVPENLKEAVKVELKRRVDAKENLTQEQYEELISK